MTYGNRCIVARNENLIRCHEIQSYLVNKAREENRKLKGRKTLRLKRIELMTLQEPNYMADYMGKCDCGCNRELYKGMSVIMHGNLMIHIDCLQAYLERHLVVL